MCSVFRAINADTNVYAFATWRFCKENRWQYVGVEKESFKSARLYSCGKFMAPSIAEKPPSRSSSTVPSWILSHP